MPFPLSHTIFQTFLRLLRSARADFHSHPLHFFSNWYFYPSFKTYISDQPSPSSLLACRVPHTTVHSRGATTCFLQGGVKSCSVLLRYRLSVGSAMSLPCFRSRWLMAIVTLRVGAFTLVWLDDPAV